MDEALEIVGGFGKYQLFTLIFGICLISNNCFLIYNISLFEAYPAFQCLNSEGLWEACTKTKACSLEKSYWKPDFEQKNSFHNWIEELDLYCSPQAEVGLLGTMLFAGILTAMIFVIPLSDKYGRRPLLIVNAVLGTVA